MFSDQLATFHASLISPFPAVLHYDSIGRGAQASHGWAPPHPPSTEQAPPLRPLQHSVAANICKHRPCNDIWLHGSLRVGGGQCNTIVRQNSSLTDNNFICQYHSAQSRPPYYPDCTGWWLWPSQCSGQWIFQRHALWGGLPTSIVGMSVQSMNSGVHRRSQNETNKCSTRACLIS